MMLSSLLLRLVLVALTMTIVCWIGWTIPGQQQLETRLAQQFAVAELSPAQPVPLATSQPPVILRPQGRIKDSPQSPVSGALDVNRATEQDLERLPGIGPVLARRIVEYRATRGTFQDVEQLRHVKGIGKKIFERIRAFVVVMPHAIRSAGKAA